MEMKVDAASTSNYLGTYHLGCPSLLLFVNVSGVNMGLNSVVIIYCNIFLPLLLDVLSVNLVLFPHPSYYLSITSTAV